MLKSALNSISILGFGGLAGSKPPLEKFATGQVDAVPLLVIRE